MKCVVILCPEGDSKSIYWYKSKMGTSPDVCKLGSRKSGSSSRSALTQRAGLKNLASKFKLNVELCKRKAISSSETLSSEVKVKQTDSDLSVTFEAAGKRRVSIKQVFVYMWKFHLLENVLLPGNQQRDEKNGETGGEKKKKKGAPHQS